MNDKNKISTKIGWKRNINYFKENINIVFKKLIEYKINFYMSALTQLAITFTLILSLYVISTNFGDIIDWEFNDFMIFMLAYDLIFTISGIFSWTGNIKTAITYGRLNNYINKPINRIIAFKFKSLSSPALSMTFFGIIKSIIIIYIFKIKFFNLFLGLIIFLLIIMFTIAMRFLIDSIGFFSFGLYHILFSIFGFSQSILRNYPEHFFKNAPFRNALLIFPAVFISILLVPILANKNIESFSYYIIILISLIIISTIGTLINWYYGLKKYEAYG